MDFESYKINHVLKCMSVAYLLQFQFFVWFMIRVTISRAQNWDFTLKGFVGLAKENFGFQTLDSLIEKLILLSNYYHLDGQVCPWGNGRSRNLSICIVSNLYRIIEKCDFSNSSAQISVEGVLWSQGNKKTEILRWLLEYSALVGWLAGTAYL